MHVRFVGEPDDGISVSSHHAAALARAEINVSFDGIPSSEAGSGEPASPDVIHLVSYEQCDGALLRRLIAARMAGTPIVRYWTHRAALWAVHHQPTGDVSRALSQLGVVQLCRTTDTRDVLQAAGIEARPIPVISPHLSNIAQPRPMPQAFTVLCHLPSQRREFHGGATIDGIIRALPAVRFLILGDTKDRYVGLKNVEALGDVADSARAMQRASVVIDARLDGSLSRVMLEALCHGRQLVSGHSLPHARVARTIHDYLEAVRTLRRGAPFNLSGREFVCREFDQLQAIKSLRRILEDATEPGRLNLAVGGQVRGAAAAIRNLHLLSKQRFPMPTAESLPPNAGLIQSLVRGTGSAVAVSA